MPPYTKSTPTRPIDLGWPPTGIGVHAPLPKGWISGRRPRLRRWISMATATVNRILDRLPPSRWMHRLAQRRLEFTDVRLPLRRGGAGLDGLRLAFLSDIHAGSFMDQEDLCALFRKVAERQPDLVCLGGDLINTRECEILMFREPLAMLDPPLGIFAVPGNHDHFFGEDLGRWGPSLQEYGVKVLNNAGTRIEHNGAHFWLAGVDDLTEGHPDLVAALHGSRADEPIVLLSHHPDFFFEAAAVHVDLMLAGHTHGGQIAPFGFAPLLHSQLGYLGGPYEEVDSMLYVGRGAGLTLLPIRVGAHPEVPIITFCRESSAGPEATP